jgi:hypothetical protein
VKQDADLRDILWGAPDIIAHMSRFYRLEAGDLIYTGTPAGVGPVVPGDDIVVSIARLSAAGSASARPNRNCPRVPRHNDRLTEAWLAAHYTTDKPAAIKAAREGVHGWRSTISMKRPH